MVRIGVVVALLLMAAGCGREGAGPTSAARPTTPTPTPLSAVVSTNVRQGNSFQVEYVSAQPPPGSSVSGYASVGSFAPEFKVRLVVRNPSDIDASGCNAWMTLQKVGGQCAQVVTASNFDLRHGESLEVEVGTPDSRFNVLYDCATPVDMTSMVATTKCAVGPEAQWGFSGWLGGAQRTWSIYYQVLP